MNSQALQALKSYFGYEQFRPHQGELVEQVLAERDVLGVMPTGAGKSLVFQVPALVFTGVTLVISPLISLMKDQVDALRQAGVEAAYLNSSLTAAERSRALAQVAEGRCRLLYVAPERLDDPRFIELCEQVEVSLVAVDEAHCVSQWGNDFRPSYRAIAGFIASLPTRPAVCALTATATAEVRDDIIEALELQDPYVCVAGFDRPNLYLGVVRPDPARKLATLLRLVAERSGQNGIVYCSTRRDSEEVCTSLQQQGCAATLYHAGLSDHERRRNQDDFLFDRANVMVATNAFGMGIDKSNIGFVIHYQMPGDLESYYQEAGRAGRDGSPADCILIYNKKDVQTVRFFAEKGHQERLLDGMDFQLSTTLYQRDLARVAKMTAYCTTPDCLRSFVLRYFGESDTPYRCEHCSSCEAESEQLEATIEAQKVLSCVLRVEQRGPSLGRAMIADILKGSAAKRLLDGGYDQLSTYGIMHEAPKDYIHTVIDALIDAGHLQVAEGKYPVISCTTQGREFLKNGDKFEFKVSVAKARVEQALGTAVGGVAGSGVAGSGWAGGGAMGGTAVGGVAGSGVAGSGVAGSGWAGGGAASGGGISGTAGGDVADGTVGRVGGGVAGGGVGSGMASGVASGAASGGTAGGEAAGRAAAGRKAEAADVDQELLARLKALRWEIAQAQGLPAFIVFHDSTLIDMCIKRPRNKEEFLAVSGVGEKKAELYAEDFLACLNTEA